MLFNYKPAPPWLKSKKSFLHCVDPLEGKIKTWREEAWERKLEKLSSSNHLNIKPNESLPPGSQLEWKCGAALTAFVLEWLEQNRTEKVGFR